MAETEQDQPEDKKAETRATRAIAPGLTNKDGNVGLTNKDGNVGYTNKDG
jgi:hypothetical protein